MGSKPSAVSASTIDLGELPPARGRGERVPERLRPRWSPRVRGRLRRGLPAAMGVLMLLSLAAAAPPAPGIERLWSVADGGEHPRGIAYAVDDPLIYLAEHDSAEGWLLRARQLADGSVKWQTALRSSPEDHVQVRLEEGVLTVTVSGRVTPTATSGFDPDTGQRWWSARGYVADAVEGALLMHGETRSRGDQGYELTQELVVRDRRTGEIDGRAWIEFDGSLALSAWQAPDGTLHVFDLRDDGEIVRYGLDGQVESVSTPHAEREVGSWQNSLAVDRGLVLVTARGGGEPGVVTAYDPATLASQWTVPAADHFGRCGTLVCVRADQSGDLRALDPRTGEPLWTITCQADWSCLVIDVRELAQEGLLWVQQLSVREGGQGHTSHTTSWIVDAETGQRLTATTQWLFAQPAGEQLLLLRHSEPDGHAHDGIGDEGAGTPTWWASLDVAAEEPFADPAEPLVLGTTEAGYCAPHLPHLVCVDEGASLSVWQIRR